MTSFHSVYKTFNALRIALIMIFMLGGIITPAQASDYTVDGVSVDVSAENGLKAREKAFEEAQVKAIKVLAGRMLSEDKAASFTAPSASNISLMIQDYEVSNEKLSGKRYSGTYKIRFQQRAADRLFAKSGGSAQANAGGNNSGAVAEPRKSVSAKPVLVLPFIQTGSGTNLWSPQNMWMSAWKSVAGNGVVIPLGDLADVQNIGDSQALSYNKLDLQAMVARYRTSEAVIALARREGAALNVQLYRTDRGTRPEFAQQITERLLAGEGEQSLHVRAASSVQKMLRGNWKNSAPQAAATLQRGVINVRARFGSLQEWSKIQNAVRRTRGVSNIRLSTLSPREAFMDVAFNGDLENLKMALAQSDLQLGAAKNMQMSSGLNASYSQGMLGARDGSQNNVVYDLYSGGNAPAYQQPVQPNQQQNYQQPSRYNQGYGAPGIQYRDPGASAGGYTRRQPSRNAPSNPDAYKTQF